MQKCSRCKKMKNESYFHKGSNNGYSSYCKPCASEYNKTKVRRKHRRVYSDNRKMECRTCGTIKAKSEYPKGRLSCKSCISHSAFIRNIESKYGITYEQWKQMHDFQGNVCAICARKEKLLVDHDHSCCAGPKSCGKCVRGLICFKCNVTLGMVSDSKDVLSRMVAYLDSFKR